MKKILVCAATPVEALACERGIKKSGVTGFEVLQTGMGVENARHALRTRLYQGKPDLVVSSGFAGIWSGEFEIGDWIGASEIWSKVGTEFSRMNIFVQKAPTEAHAPLVSVDVIGAVPSSGLPSELGTGLVAVDMESAGLAEICAENALLFTVFRMVTDTPRDPLPEFVSTWTSAFQSPSWEDKFKLGSKGLMEVARDFGSVKNFLVQGRQWALDLERGWAEGAEKFL
jgi:hypothetical protein